MGGIFPVFCASVAGHGSIAGHGSRGAFWYVLPHNGKFPFAEVAAETIRARKGKLGQRRRTTPGGHLRWRDAREAGGRGHLKGLLPVGMARVHALAGPFEHDRERCGAAAPVGRSLGRTASRACHSLPPGGTLGPREARSTIPHHAAKRAVAHGSCIPVLA